MKVFFYLIWSDGWFICDFCDPQKTLKLLKHKSAGIKIDIKHFQHDGICWFKDKERKSKKSFYAALFLIFSLETWCIDENKYFPNHQKWQKIYWIWVCWKILWSITTYKIHSTLSRKYELVFLWLFFRHQINLNFE